MCISWISIYFRYIVLNKDNFFQNLLKGILAPAARLSVAQQVGTNKLFGNNQPVNDTLAQSILGNKVYQDVEQQPLKEGLFKSMLSAATTGAGFALPFSQYKAIPRLAGNVGLGALGGYSSSDKENELKSSIQGGVLGGVLGEVVPLVLNKGNSTLRELSNKYGFREGNLDRYGAYLKMSPKNPLNINDATFVTKKPITLYRGTGKGIGNTTFVSGKYYADTPEFAKTFGDNIEVSNIPENTKIFDFDIIKKDPNQNIIPQTTLVDPEKTRKFLLDNGFTMTKNTNTRGVEYVDLLAKRPKEVIKDVMKQFKTEKEFLDYISSKEGFDKYRNEMNSLVRDMGGTNSAGNLGRLWSEVVKEKRPVKIGTYELEFVDKKLKGLNTETLENLSKLTLDKIKQMSGEMNIKKAADAQKMKDMIIAELERRAEQPLRFFHGTNTDFGDFDISKSSGGNLGKAMYLTDDPKAATYYGDIIKTYEVPRGTKLFDMKGVDSGISEFKKAAELYKKATGKELKINASMYNNPREEDTIVRYFWRNPKLNKEIELAKNLWAESLRKAGYQGIREADTVAIFDPKIARFIEQKKIDRYSNGDLPF